MTFDDYWYGDDVNRTFNCLFYSTAGPLDHLNNEPFQSVSVSLIFVANKFFQRNLHYKIFNSSKLIYLTAV